MSKLNYFQTRPKVPSFNINAYLERIHLNRETPSLSYLKKLQKNHLIHIPFENLDIHFQQHIEMDMLQSYNKIVPSTRGGFCYEFNPLFYGLLSHLGFDCYITSGSFYKADGSFGPEYEHIAIIVLLDDDLWLADVGLVDGFIEPKKIEANVMQVDYTQYFQIVKDHDDRYLLKKSSDASQFETVFRFDLQERQLIEFLSMCRYQQESIDSYFRQHKIVSRLHPDGRVILTDQKLKLRLRGQKEEKSILNEDEFLSKLEEYFGITLQDLIQ
ncbi:MAG: arylamine N-acetyltransferase [Cyclobacteriaceae bacterium]|nr:arylamine N-acetyltransferase [Cyclobacteriaceae bacterium HetDA_MAG_MS6]